MMVTTFYNYINPIINLKLNEKFDLIISDLPFGARENYFFKDEKITDMGLAIVARCIGNLNDNGYIAVPSINAITFNSKFLKILTKMEEESLYLNALIDLPAGTYAPLTGIPCKFAIFSKNFMKERFIAQLSSQTEIDELINSFLNKKKRVFT